ncbi:MAG: hypothetical protein AAB618_04050 [Patescibacteria group bacterium]
MRLSKLISAALLLFIGWWMVEEGLFTWVMPGSKLGIFESPIQAPGTELMRRSLELSKNFEDFTNCQKQPDCDSAAILANRDVIIKRAWPDVYSRLEVRGDWLVCSVLESGVPYYCQDAWSSQDEFEEMRAKVGSYRLQYECQPDIIYRADTSGRVVYDTYGYKCLDDPQK